MDEVGRGAIFGPVVAAAVLVDQARLAQFQAIGVRDSKQLTEAKRLHVAAQIYGIAIDCQVGVASTVEIEKYNILQASLIAMRRAIAKLALQPQHCLIDGKFQIPNLLISQTAIVRGDQTSLVIAAASIIAKVWRDQLIQRLAAHYPRYGLNTNKGYGTVQHRRSVHDYGISKLHRKSFKISAP